MDVTTLVMAVDTTQVGTAAHAMQQLVNNGNTAATSASKVTAAFGVQATAMSKLIPITTSASSAYKQLSRTPISLTMTAELAAASGALESSARNAFATQHALNEVANVSGKSAIASNTLAAANKNATVSARQLAREQLEQAKAARLATFQNQQLGFQLNDFFVQVASGGSPVIALIQQGTQLSDTYGGIGNALRAIGGIITPVRVAIGATAGAVGALAFSFYEGMQQSHAFADAIVLTGNFAGQTEGKFNALTKQIAETGQVSIGSAREFAQAVLSTGEIAPQVFSSAVEAAALYGQSTGKTAEQVAADFAKMARAPTEFASETSRSMNLVTAAQFETIKALEEGGRAADAQGILLDAINERYRKLDGNLGTIERTLRSVKNEWSAFWNSAYDIGRSQTIESKLDGAADRIREFNNEQKKLGNFEPGAAARQAAKGVVSNSLTDQRRELLRQQFRESENAAAESFRAQANKEAIAADKVIDAYLKRGKAATTYKQKLDELNRGFTAKENAGVPVSAADKSVALAQLKKEFTSRGNNEASQLLRAALDQDLKAFQEEFEKERDAIEFHNRFLQGEYQAGALSLREYYADKRTTTAQAVASEIAGLEKERARLEQYRRTITDPSERTQVQTRLNENTTQQQRARDVGDREIQLSNQDEAASFRTLNEMVINYRANLAQLQGDEVAAAKLRAQITLDNARVLAIQAALPGGIAGVDVTALQRVLETTNEFANMQNQASQAIANASRAEQAFGLVSEQTGKSLIETERGIMAIRSEELAQLGALAAKAKELADASTDPRIKGFAADLALQHAKAANAIDPALTRLREASKGLAADISSTVAESVNTFSQVYNERRRAATQDLDEQRGEFSEKIDVLEGYLAKTQDATDKARLRARIKTLEDRRNSIDGDSKGESLLKTFGETVLAPVGKSIFETANKLFIQDPLQAFLEGQLTSLTEGKGSIASILQSALGVKDDPKQAALLAQTASIQSSTAAMSLLEAAARSAADALGVRGGTVNGGQVGAPAGAGTDALGASLETARFNADEFASTATTASTMLAQFANVGGEAGQALSALPSIIRLIEAASASSAASSTSSGWASALGSLFSSSGSSGGAAEAFSTVIFHDGGVVGGPAATRYASPSLFAAATRYHTGGVAGRAADKLKPGEVPAILMRGEEVLREDDPRHRENITTSVMAQIMDQSLASNRSASDLIKAAGRRKSLFEQDDDAKAWGGVEVKGARELGGPVSPNSAYRVNERRPELLQMAGKQYLMTGSQGGVVKDPGQAAGQPQINQEVHFHSEGPVDRRTQQQVAAAAYRGIQRASVRNN